MAPTQKGKQGSKGAKQIVEENKATLKFYKTMAIGCSAGATLLNVIFFGLSQVSIMGIIAVLSLAAAVQFMVFMSRPRYSENGAILDSGNDLNMEGGIAENVKDLIILTSGTLILSLLSNYFWFLLLLAPLRAIWMLWGSIIKPWLAQRNSGEHEPEIDEKKQRKMERKMRRMR
ncbi:transmembrane protein 208 isoform X2 [Eurosta solidaginis]|uniref:transmembrane protein 208 isoform X2 n=1 Tax=Eurosta solidaginis TaxID=178769 RepID=UPI003530B88B